MSAASMMADCDRQIAQLQKVKALVAQHPQLFDGVDGYVNQSGRADCISIHTKFYSDANGGCRFDVDVKDVCRAFGGSWKKDRVGNRVDYSTEGDFKVTIFGAEKRPESNEEVIL